MACFGQFLRMKSGTKKVLAYSNSLQDKNILATSGLFANFSQTQSMLRGQNGVENNNKEKE